MITSINIRKIWRGATRISGNSPSFLFGGFWRIWKAGEHLMWCDGCLCLPTNCSVSRRAWHMRLILLVGLTKNNSMGYLNSKASSVMKFCLFYSVCCLGPYSNSSSAALQQIF